MAKEAAPPLGTLDDKAIDEKARGEIDFIEKRRGEVKSANKEISAAFDRLDAIGLDKKAVKAHMQRRKLDEDQRARFDRTLARVAKIYGDQGDLFANDKDEDEGDPVAALPGPPKGAGKPAAAAGAH